MFPPGQLATTNMPKAILAGGESLRVTVAPDQVHLFDPESGKRL